MVRPSLSKLFLATLLSLAPGAARAGNNGWFTTYDSNVERGEIELMLMNDYTAPSELRREDGQRDYVSHMLELEYGVTDQLATELMIEAFEEPGTGQAKFTGFRWEARYRLFKEHVPLNPMLYAEYEDLDVATRFKMEVSGWVKTPYQVVEKESARERVLEGRLVLSDRFGPFDVAVNAVIEAALDSSTVGFGYSAGVMWMPGHGEVEACDLHGAPAGDAFACPMHPEQTSHGPGACPKCGMAMVRSLDGDAASGGHAGCSCKTTMKGGGCGHCSGRGGACSCAHAGMVGLGLELYGALGDTRVFGLRGNLQEHYLGPIMMVHITPRLMVHTQLAIGLTQASDELVRVNVGYEF